MSDTTSTEPNTETTETSAYTPPASQEELSRIVEERLARERKKYEGYDDYKAKAAKYDELEEGKKTPDQKAIDEAKSSAATEVTQKFLRRLVSTETKSVARDLNFIDPDDALRVLGDELPVKDDEPDVDAIKKLVEKLAEDKPHLVDGGTRKPRTRPKPAAGERQEETDGPKAGKGKAAAALRQLATNRGR